MASWPNRGCPNPYRSPAEIVCVTCWPSRFNCIVPVPAAILSPRCCELYRAQGDAERAGTVGHSFEAVARGLIDRADDDSWQHASSGIGDRTADHGFLRERGYWKEKKDHRDERTEGTLSHRFSSGCLYHCGF